MMSVYKMLTSSKKHHKIKKAHHHRDRVEDDEKRISGGHQKRFSSSSSASSKSRARVGNGHLNYYQQKEKEQFRNLHMTICSEIAYHEKQILQHEQQIRLHEEAIETHKKQISEVMQKRNNVKHLEEKYFSKIPGKRHKMEHK